MKAQVTVQAFLCCQERTDDHALVDLVYGTGYLPVEAMSYDDFIKGVKVRLQTAYDLYINISVKQLCKIGKTII